MNLKAIQGAINFAKGISDSPQSQNSNPLKSRDYPSKYPALSPLESLTQKKRLIYLDRLTRLLEKNPKWFRSVLHFLVLTPRF